MTEVQPPETVGQPDYGINPRTNQPYKASPEHRAKLQASLQKAREEKARTNTGRASSARRASSASKEKTPHQTYTTTAEGLLQMFGFPLAILGKFTGNPAWTLDSLAISVHGPAFASAVADVAIEDANWARVLDKMAEVGPYGVLFMAGLPLGGQFLLNHGVGAPNETLGILDPIDLMRAAGLTPPEPMPDASEPPDTAGDAGPVPTL